MPPGVGKKKTCHGWLCFISLNCILCDLIKGVFFLLVCVHGPINISWNSGVLFRTSDFYKSKQMGGDSCSAYRGNAQFILQSRPLVWTPYHSVPWILSFLLKAMSFAKAGKEAEIHL